MTDKEEEKILGNFASELLENQKQEPEECKRVTFDNFWELCYNFDEDKDD